MTTATVPSPPELKTLRLEIDGEIGTLTLDRPKVLNAMSPELIGELVTAAAWLADRAPLRALIVTGDGPGVLGRRRRQLVQARPRGVRRVPVGRRAPRRRRPAPGDRRLPPHPLSGDRARSTASPRAPGFSLALMCDTRIASEEAAFVCAYGRIGASPDGGMTYFLPRMVGPARAIELLLERPAAERRAGARDGHRRRGRARRRADGARRGRRPRSWPPRRPTTCGCRSSWSPQSLDNTLADHLQLERHGIADSMATEDLREGVTAFLEGREATFTGR